MDRSIILYGQIIVEFSLSPLYFCGENVVPLSTRVCVRAPGLKNNAEIYCLGINASITCQNYSFCCQCYTFPHAVLFLLVHHNYTVAYDTTRTGTAALCSEQCAVTHRAVVLLV